MCLKYNKHCRSVFYHYESALLVLIAFIIIYCCINFFQMEQYLADGVIGRRDSDILKQSKLYSYLDDDEDNLHKPTFPIITKKPPSIEIKIAKSTSTQAVDKKSSTKSFTTTATVSTAGKTDTACPVKSGAPGVSMRLMCLSRTSMWTMWL